MDNQFKKRLYDVETFYRFLEDVIANFGQVRTAMKSQRLSKAFSERILLAVTQVNGCRYCSYFHTQEALKAGMSEEEIQSLLSGEFGEVPAEEAVALFFAEHYAESAGNPEPEAWQRVVSSYGPEVAQDILSTIRVIMVGNLHGNMLDALRSRLSGKPFPDSTLGQEMSIVFGILLFIPMIAIKQGITKLFALKKGKNWPKITWLRNKFERVESA